MRQPSTIDLSQLPPPALIDALDAESYVAAAIADYRARWPEWTAVLESEPVIKFVEVLAYREALLRARVNTAALATLLAKSFGADLDHIGARFNVARLAGEADERFRRRIQLAPEAFSTAGPPGAYEFWALTLAPSIADAYAYSPQPGVVHVMVAMEDGADVAPDDITAIAEFLAREDVGPLTDAVSVLAAERVDYTIQATLQIRRGPDPQAVKAQALARLAAYRAERYAIGNHVYRVGITAALKAGGVDNVLMPTPASDVVIGQHQVARLVLTVIETAVI
jgi:phage-related baseplate assembly protein